MAVDRYVPTQEQITEAIDTRNAEMIAKYALAIEFDKQDQSERLPGLLDVASNAKRDLDVCKAVIKNHAETIKLMQSILRQLRSC